MNQSGMIIGALAAAFVVYLAMNGKLPAYWAVLTGGKPSGSGTTSSSGGSGGSGSGGSGSGGSGSGGSGSGGSGSGTTSSGSGWIIPPMPSIGFPGVKAL